MNSEAAFNKSYDSAMGFSRITQQSWLAPDRDNYMPFGLTQEQWVDLFLKPQLDSSVPLDVLKVFEVARGAMIYSWFFYPLATLGLEQCTRVAEFAVWERCKSLPDKPRRFVDNLKTLTEAGVISQEDEPRWQAVRTLRNDRSHLKKFMLTDPGEVSIHLRNIVELINELFSTVNPHEPSNKLSAANL